MTQPVTTPLPAPEATSPRAPWWKRHPRLLVALVVALVALVTVLTDLPVHTSRTDDIAAQRSVMSEVNSDLASCALGVHQAVGIWKLADAHQLTGSERAPTPGLLSDDQTACTLTNQGVYDLSTIEPPGTAAGKYVGQMVATAMLWTTSDALRVIEDVQTLMDHPANAAARRDLAKEESLLNADRRKALAQEHAADRVLHTQLPPVNLPSVSVSSGANAN